VCYKNRNAPTTSTTITPVLAPTAIPVLVVSVEEVGGDVTGEFDGEEVVGYLEG
jgi:hypothetical protein